MKRLLLLICGILFFQPSYSQKRFRNTFPKSALSLQYAGSIGFLSIGFFKITESDKFEFGVLYGNVPHSLGGPVHSLTLKGAYNPFRFNVWKRIKVEPLQTGIFVCQNFNENLRIRWGQKYPKGYYWWNRSTTIHFFASAQASYLIDGKSLDRIACYFETNTNTLYMHSYFPNMKTMKLYDIFFFGGGIKTYIK